jgi:hypothetical protein
MGLRTGETVERKDPVGIDQEERAWEGVGGASQQVVTDILTIKNSAGDSYSTGATVTTDECPDCILTQLYYQLKYVAGGTRAIDLTITLGGEEVLHFEGNNGQNLPAMSIPLPNWRVREGTPITYTSSVGAGGAVVFIMRLYGFPSA